MAAAVAFSPEAAAPGGAFVWLRWLLIACLAAATVYGAGKLAFLCDDAFIHFRYAANARSGAGLVWNPPPFAPVEGAGFLWVMLLWGAWSIFGVEPPSAANPLSIGLGVVQLLLLAAAVHRLRGRDGARLPMAVGLCALAVVVGNRTFLQWLSSGLDTALFNVWMLWWTLHAFRSPAHRGRYWLATWSLAAAMAVLTRPDGLPLAAATVAVAGWHVLRGRARLGPTLAGLSPLSLVVALTVWRLGYYGEWLPNTYFAKVVSIWPEAGWRYFACFALENGAWLWFPLFAIWFVHALRGPFRTNVRALADHVPALAATGAVVFHAGYYLFAVGGDHFEYRVLSQLVPLGTLASVAVAGRLGRGALLPIATAAGLGLAGCVGWAHLAIAGDLAFHGVKAVTPSVPAPLRPLARWYDRQQMWLFLRFVGLRCSHHDFLLRTYSLGFPARRWIATTAEPFPVLTIGAVGLPGYFLPDCVILDEFGLNDWVIARTPVASRAPLAAGLMARAVADADADRDGFLDLPELRRAVATAHDNDPNETRGDFALRFLIESHATVRADAVSIEIATVLGDLYDAPRRMAHERLPPPGYIDAFDPNVTLVGAEVAVRPRTVPLTRERIEAIEAEWRATVQSRAGQ